MILCGSVIKIINELAGEVYIQIKRWFNVRRPEGVRNERKRKEPPEVM
jgi:hypothetical protein